MLEMISKVVVEFEVIVLMCMKLVITFFRSS